jgi:hypothetical protein
MYHRRKILDFITFALCKALIKSVMTHACPTWEYVAGAQLLKLHACRTEYSALLETLTVTDQSAYCAWFSKFLTCMTI